MKVALDIGHCSTGDQGAVSRDGNIRTPYANRGDVFLQGTVCPAVIVEGAFLSVDSDVEFLHEKGEVLAQAVAHGIHAYAVQCGA